MNTPHPLTTSISHLLIFSLMLSCAPDPSTLCNGLSQLCEKRIDEVIFAGTHMSASNQEDEWAGPLQAYGIAKQLEDGIRAFDINLHWWQNRLYMCHGDCNLGATPFADALENLQAFLQEHPYNVIIVTTHTSNAYLGNETQDVLTHLDITSEMHTLSLDQDMPTLRSLIDAQQRLLIFTDDTSVGDGAYMRRTPFWFENESYTSSIDDFTCTLSLGDGSQSLFSLTHYLSDPFGRSDLAEKANQEPVITQHIDDCLNEHGTLPTQILVDYHNIGALLEVVHTYNSTP